jgi:hypothetical protein
MDIKLIALIRPAHGPCTGVDVCVIFSVLRLTELSNLYVEVWGLHIRFVYRYSTECYTYLQRYTTSIEQSFYIRHGTDLCLVECKYTKLLY